MRRPCSIKLAQSSNNVPPRECSTITRARLQLLLRGAALDGQLAGAMPGGRTSTTGTGDAWRASRRCRRTTSAGGMSSLKYIMRQVPGSRRKALLTMPLARRIVITKRNINFQTRHDAQQACSPLHMVKMPSLTNESGPATSMLASRHTELARCKVFSTQSQHCNQQHACGLQAGNDSRRASGAPGEPRGQQGRLAQQPADQRGVAARGRAAHQRSACRPRRTSPFH